MVSSDSQVDKAQCGCPKRAELPDINTSKGTQSINTERPSLSKQVVLHNCGELHWLCCFSRQGELVEDSSIQRSCLVTSFAWHPVRKILAIGWESGDVLIWNEHDHELHEAFSVHKSKIRVVKWSNNGSRLVTADDVSFGTVTYEQCSVINISY